MRGINQYTSLYVVFTNVELYIQSTSRPNRVLTLVCLEILAIGQKGQRQQRKTNTVPRSILHNKNVCISLTHFVRSVLVSNMRNMQQNIRHIICSFTDDFRIFLFH